jgi:hypothetical protein
MPGDPAECRAHARRCSELAANAKTPQLKKTLSDLSRSWAQLAVQLETTQALLDRFGSEASKPEPARKLTA